MLDGDISPLLQDWLRPREDVSPFRASIERRLNLQQRCLEDARFRALELEACRRDVVLWFYHWAWTYDPRAAAEGKPAWLPFDLYVRQVQMAQFFNRCLAARHDGLVEKSRDIGFTWEAGGFALHKWIFQPGFKSTFGSRKQEYVDRLGDPDSIFEKIRMLYRSLPRWMWPKQFDPSKHDNHLRILNPDNGNTISGEAGDEMGRGGRSSMYILDEFAFVERADRVDAATSANTNVRIFASTVNGPGNLFALKAHAPEMAPWVFRFHFRDDPRKDQAWETAMRAKLDPAKFASEYDIDYSASVEGICIPGRWVEAATRIDGLWPSRRGIAGLDVGAGGRGKSVFIARFGAVVTMPVPWGDPDTIETAHKGLDLACDTRPLDKHGEQCAVRVLNYDSVGVGHGVSAALKRAHRPGLSARGVNTGIAPSERVWPDGETSVEKFANLKAELWFLARERFKATYETVRALEGYADGIMHPPEELISLPVEARTLMTQLATPKWFRTEKGKIIMETKKQLSDRGIPSPDEAEALVLTFDEDGTLETWAKFGVAR